MSKESVVRNNVLKWLVLVLLAALSWHVTMPAKDKVRLGLDLKGGTSFTLDASELRRAHRQRHPQAC